MNQPAKRGPGRPRKNPVVESPSIVAEAAPAREPVRTPARKSLREKLSGKQRLDNLTTNQFHIDDDRIPEGVSLEWKRHSCYGKEDPYYLAAQERQGWTTMTAEDFPELAPATHTSEPIIKGGLVLMARPVELTEAAMAETNKRTNQRVNDLEREVGTARGGSAREQNNFGIGRETVRMVVDKD